MTKKLKSYSEFVAGTRGSCFPDYSKIKKFDLRGLAEMSEQKGVQPYMLPKKDLEKFYIMR